VLLYLDLNCFNRPFDDQNQERIAQETTAVLSILQRIIEEVDRLAWSAVLDFENVQHPLVDRRTEIGRWAQRAVRNIAINEQISTRAQELSQAGFGALDAAHLACAETAACDYLLTCDDPMLRRAQRVALTLRVYNPLTYLEEQTDD
jgi:predicted nucleic acid-binding protein